MDYNKKILEFFTNELSQDERAALKGEMVVNSELKEDMKLQQEVLFSIANEQDDFSDFRKQLEGIGNELLNEDKNDRRSFPQINYWLAAASVVIVVGLASYLGLLQDSTYNNDQAFADYYVAYGSDLTIRGAESSNDFTKAVEMYQAGDMEQAIEAFAEIEDENVELAGFFIALCNMEMGNIENAKIKLYETKENSIFYEEQIKWYLALCHIKLDEYKEAELLLTQLMTANGAYSQQSGALLKKLDF